MGSETPSLAALLERLRGPSRTVTVYGPEAYDELEELLAQFSVELVHESLPIPESEGYLTVRTGEVTLGTLPAAAFGELVDPSRDSPWDEATRASAFRDLTPLLSETAFRATDRRHLLATSREFEDRAYRVGRGRLHAGFQSLASFRHQLPIYQRLAHETDLDVTVYGEPDWRPSDSPDVDVRSDDGGELGRYWVLAFDGGGTDEMACALVAEETDAGSYDGAWTYDPGLVADVIEYLEATYGGERGGGDATGSERNG